MKIKSKNKTLHIYIDESGNFEYNKEGSSNYFVISFVLTEDTSFEKERLNLFNQLHKVDDSIELIHCAPLIRQKDEYEKFELAKRVKILDIFFSFLKSIKISSFIILSNKENRRNLEELQNDLIKKIKKYLNDNISYFSKYTNFVVHYDNGQVKLSNILKLSFNESLRNVLFVFNDVMKKQILIQVADVIATIGLINEKYTFSKTNSRERTFFKTEDNFKKRYYKEIQKILNKINL